MQETIEKLINSVGENVTIDDVSKKALVQFGTDERGFDIKVLTFIPFADSYSKITFRGVDYALKDVYIDEFGVAKVILGEINE
jgi:hypothetical protein